MYMMLVNVYNQYQYKHNYYQDNVIHNYLMMVNQLHLYMNNQHMFLLMNHFSNIYLQLLLLLFYMLLMKNQYKNYKKIKYFNIQCHHIYNLIKNYHNHFKKLLMLNYYRLYLDKHHYQKMQVANNQHLQLCLLFNKQHQQQYNLNMCFMNQYILIHYIYMLAYMKCNQIIEQELILQNMIFMNKFLFLYKLFRFQ